MTTIPANIARIVWSGTTPNNTDIWNVRVHALASTSIDGFFLQEIAETAYDAWCANFYVGTCAPLFNASTTCEAVTAYALDTSGHASEVQIASTTTNPIHGSGSLALPSEVALCASVETGAPGRSKRGRSFLPGLDCAALDVVGFLQLTFAQDIATAYAAVLGTINAHAYIDSASAEVVVLSEKMGAAYPVTEVKVGQILDVQRRRRNGAPETYKSAALPA